MSHLSAHADYRHEDYFFARTQSRALAAREWVHSGKAAAFLVRDSLSRTGCCGRVAGGGRSHSLTKALSSRQAPACL